MKYAIAIVLLFVAAASAQWHGARVGHGVVGHGVVSHGAVGHVGAGHWGGHRYGRSIVAAPVWTGSHVGLVGAHGVGLGHGLVHHRYGRSILLAQPAIPGTTLVHGGLWHGGLVGHHGLLL